MVVIKLKCGELQDCDRREELFDLFASKELKPFKYTGFGFKELDADQWMTRKAPLLSKTAANNGACEFFQPKTVTFSTHALI